ncbi:MULTISPECIES: MOSC domain-containing protein [unclassified Cellulophaga]|uniref:MOSC domain-containing protein n=1 Tax=unclassified Cellulophaga TaxID=2634405 RepID=UPI0026E4185F|nr:MULTISPECIES: MOSC domain-containing protein [unclassified Cellulophaga]MDO6492632.1 MOSC domain-containing protein [Cellulophaga sp. 2_MG-2023]MDO6495889.1 MOSC domain-containing protein [Cellulophaga sp. 3_MG-2023]
MKVVATNLGKPTKIQWNGKEEVTGIYKYPTTTPLQLLSTDVINDTVIDRKHHGGIDKACYLFSADVYDYWKNIYPNLDWNWGMFGENLSVEGLDETTLRIGDIYKIGTALVQVSQPREPCYKLGIRFGNQQILKQFIDHNRPGTYIRILKEGSVQTGDVFKLIEQSTNKLTIQDFYKLLYAKEKNKETIKLAVSNMALPEKKRIHLSKYL